MATTDPRTVVVTGASAGIGRAAAQLFGERGANVGLLARGQAGLDGAVRDVEKAGGSALAYPTDVAEYQQVEDAAQRVEDTFDQISPDEFRRVTEVAYLGFVYGTMVALRRMKQRDAGTIVQVGSALGLRSIPLQSAYCGAKHAVNGFTESLRCELMHEGSNVHVTVVQMPAVNTPQFSWVLSRLPKHPQPVPPIYQPEVAGRAVVYAADHPECKQYWVGGSTVGTVTGQKLAGGLLDRYLARTGYQSQQTSEPVPQDRPHNLWEPVDGAEGADHGAHGEFDASAHGRSRQLALPQHRRLATNLASAAGLSVLGAAAAAVVRGRR